MCPRGRAEFADEGAAVSRGEGARPGTSPWASPARGPADGERRRGDPSAVVQPPVRRRGRALPGRRHRLPHPDRAARPEPRRREHAATVSVSTARAPGSAGPAIVRTAAYAVRPGAGRNVPPAVEARGSAAPSRPAKTTVRIRCTAHTDRPWSVTLTRTTAGFPGRDTARGVRARSGHPLGPATARLCGAAGIGPRTAAAADSRSAAAGTVTPYARGVGGASAVLPGHGHVGVGMREAALPRPAGTSGGTP